MKKGLVGALQSCLLLWTCACGAEQGLPLTFGIFPYVNPGAIVKHHGSLKTFLERALKRPVRLVTASNFTEFVRRTRAHKYDLVLTAPHLGRLAEVRDDYRRVAMTSHLIQGVFVTPSDSGIDSLAGLRDKTITMAAPESIIFQMARKALYDRGLVDGKTMRLQVTSTHNNALYACVRRESDACLTGQKIWKALDDTAKRALRIVAWTDQAPGFTLMANPHLNEATIRNARKAVFEFSQSRVGADYLFDEFEPITDVVMQELDPYVEGLK